MSAKLLDHKSGWVFFMPVRGLDLFEAVNYEYRIDRVTFLRTSKLPHRRRRFGLPSRLAELKERFGTLPRLLEENNTIAIARASGVGREVAADLLERASDELSILSLSQLGYSRRRRNAQPVIAERLAGADLRSGLLVSCETGEASLSLNRRGKTGPLQLTSDWVGFQNDLFFTKLVKILRKEVPVSPTWRQALWDAAVLGGQSQGSSDKAQCFLWNIIALEALLAEHDDKKSDALPSRIKAFIGWAQDWEVERYEQKIDAAYKKRSALVHQGKRDIVKIEDVLFTDDLLLNVLINIVSHPKRFGSKSSIIEFSRQVEAERILGVRPSVRPKTLQMLKPHYSEEDFQRL